MTIADITIPELEAHEALTTIKVGGWVLAVIFICATILALVLLRDAREQEKHRHQERSLAIEATRDVGQTAWTKSDVHKDQIIRDQAKTIQDLAAWKARTEDRLKKLKLTEVLNDVQV